LPSAKPLFSVKGIVFSALFGALVSIMSLVTIRVGVSPVPITLENMAVMITGALLGAFYGFFSLFLIVFLLLLGLPLLHLQGGFGLLTGTTGGFIWMFPISALLIGWFVGKVKGTGWQAYVATFLALEIFGSLLLYISGVPWLAHVLHVPFAKAMALGCYPYLIGDMVKALAATLIIVPIRHMFPRLR
jgi:biotin transport system substrate-specific component